jgi:hypothetical protein
VWANFAVHLGFGMAWDSTTARDCVDNEGFVWAKILVQDMQATLLAEHDRNCMRFDDRT